MTFVSDKKFDNDARSDTPKAICLAGSEPSRNFKSCANFALIKPFLKWFDWPLVQARDLKVFCSLSNLGNCCLFLPQVGSTALSVVLLNFYFVKFFGEKNVSRSRKPLKLDRKQTQIFKFSEFLQFWV